MPTTSYWKANPERLRLELAQRTPEPVFDTLPHGLDARAPYAIEISVRNCTKSILSFAKRSRGQWLDEGLTLAVSVEPEDPSVGQFDVDLENLSRLQLLPFDESGWSRPLVIWFRPAPKAFWEGGTRRVKLRIKIDLSLQDQGSRPTGLRKAATLDTELLLIGHPAPRSYSQPLQ